MKVYFGQIWVTSTAQLNFSHHFQIALSDVVSGLVAPSREFIQRFGEDYCLTIRISAKNGISNNEIKGPIVYKRDKEAEFVVFLPFDSIIASKDGRRSAIRQ
jgi:hypothetical protein